MVWSVSCRNGFKLSSEAKSGSSGFALTSIAQLAYANESGNFVVYVYVAVINQRG